MRGDQTTSTAVPESKNQMPAMEGGRDRMEAAIEQDDEPHSCAPVTQGALEAMSPLRESKAMADGASA